MQRKKTDNSSSNIFFHMNPNMMSYKACQLKQQIYQTLTRQLASCSS